MSSDVRDVHLDQAIEKRRVELGISKSELGRRIGVSQQHVNRILERETMETNKLFKVCQALECNFFSLFCLSRHQFSAQLVAVSLDGDANNIGDSVLAIQLLAEQTNAKHLNETIKLLKDQIEGLKAQISRLDSNLQDKDAIIDLLKEKRQ